MNYTKNRRDGVGIKQRGTFAIGVNNKANKAVGD